MLDRSVYIFQKSIFSFFRALRTVFVWLLASLGIVATFVSPIYANSFPFEITNTATVAAPTGWTESDEDNNKSSATLSKLARLKIRKTTEGGDGTFEFSSDNTTVDGVEISTTNLSGESEFLPVEVGTHALSENPSQGWSLKSISCVDPDDGTQIDVNAKSVELDVDAYEDIECTFVNQKNASLTLTKLAQGGDGTFEFDSALESLDGSTETIELTTNGGTAQKIYTNIKPGSYTLAELAQDGWDLTSITCNLESTDSFLVKTDADEDGVLDGSDISFDLVPNESAACTFTNRKAAPNLNVTKTSVGSVTYVGDDTYSVGVKISVVNSGNTPIVLSEISDDLSAAFGSDATITSVSVPVYASNSDNFAGTLNPQYDGLTQLKGNTSNLLATSAKLKVDQMLAVSFAVEFKPVDIMSVSVMNVAASAGTGAGLAVSDTSHNSDQYEAEGNAPTPIAIDPSGVVYDSITMDPVEGAIATLVDSNGDPLPAACLASGQQNQITGPTGDYRFDINVGASTACPITETMYSIVVTPPPAYSFESVIRPVSGSDLDATPCILTAGLCSIDSAFSVASAAAAYTYYLAFAIGAGDPDVVNNHIPLDPAATLGDLSIAKTAGIASASIGDVIPYQLVITNENTVPHSSFDIVDQLPTGLSYIPNSALVSVQGSNDTPLAIEPTSAGNQLTWRIDPSLPAPYTAISPASSFQLDFQARVVATQAYGSLVNTAILNDFSGIAISGASSASVELRAEPIFHCSSVIGTVFHDENGDGILNNLNDRAYDADTMTPEKGIPQARLFTVNGQWITADAFGRYNVPCAMLPQQDIGSNFALKLHGFSLPEGLVPPKSNPQVVRLTPGIMAVLNFAVTQGDQKTDNLEKAVFDLPIFAKDQSSIPGVKNNGETFDGPVYLATFDLTARQRLGDALNTADNDDTQIDGRLAIYLKGRIKGDALLTLMADTGEGSIKGLFNDFMDQDQKAYLKRIDQTRYYPVFGDDSDLVEDAPTSGKLYVRLEKGNSRFVWGSVRTELNDSAFIKANRVLYGAKLHLQTEKDQTYSLDNGKTFIPGKTVFDDARATLDAYAAQPASKKARDDFRGHMGTVFYLRNADVLPGSEVIEIEVRKSLTGTATSVKRLVYGQDYLIDYIFGRITLHSPLPGSLSGATLFDLTGTNGDQVYLTVDYSYANGFGQTDDVVAGGSASVWVDDHIRLGVNGQKETSGGDNFELVSGDVTFKLNENAQVKFEVAHSRGKASTTQSSDDGGFTWTEFMSQSNDFEAANGVNAELNMNLSPYLNGEGSVTATYENKGAGFIDQAGRTSVNTESFNMEATIEMSDDEKILLTTQVLKTGQDLAQQHSLSYKKSLNEDSFIEVSAQVHSKNGDDKNLIGARYQTAITPDVDVRLFGALEVGSKSLEDDGFIGVGLDYDPFENLRVSLDATRSHDNRYNASIAGTWKRDEDSDFYLSYLVGDDRIAANGVTLETSHGLQALTSGQFVAGGRQSLGDHLTLSGEEKLYLNDGSINGSTHAYRLEWDDKENWHVGLGVERGEVSQKERLAIAASVRLTFDTTDTSALFEYREDNDLATNESTKTYVGRASQSVKVDDDWRYILNAEGMSSRKEGQSLDEGLYFKANVGAAYRPKNRDEWAALMMYTYLHDLPPEQQLDKGQFKQIAHLFSAEASYRVSPDLRLTTKYGLKAGKQTLNRTSDEWSDMLVQLGIVRADIRLNDKFDALLEGRLMAIQSPDELRSALLGALYYRLNDQIKLGGGYVFGSTSNDLINHVRDDQGWFINLVGAF